MDAEGQLGPAVGGRQIVAAFGGDKTWNGAGVDGFRRDKADGAEHHFTHCEADQPV